MTTPPAASPRFTASTTGEVLADTAAVAEFMHAFQQPVRTTPTADIPDEERLLRVRLVLEEALEFAEAMGCIVSAPDEGGLLTAKTAVVDLDEFADIDLVEATDALADIIVVTKGSAHSLGVPVDAAFRAVHRSNLRKLGPDGNIVYIPGTNKVGKPAGWVPPTEDIRALLGEPSGTGNESAA